MSIAIRGCRGVLFFFLPFSVQLVQVKLLSKKDFCASRLLIKVLQNFKHKMSPGRIKIIQENNFKVCRFCLHANAAELSSIYEKIADDVIAMNTTIRGVLAMLNIEV